jgi:hypothetical protein
MLLLFPLVTFDNQNCIGLNNLTKTARIYKYLNFTLLDLISILNITNGKMGYFLSVKKFAFGHSK